MRTRILAASLALAALGAVPAAAEPAPLVPATLSGASAVDAALAMQNGDVRVWMNGGDVFRSGDRMRVNVRTERDGYLAVFHIDTNGDLDVLYPRSYDDDGWVDGGRTLSLGSRGGWDYLRVRGGVGMGYVFAVMLDEPLELWRVRDLYRPRYAGWDASRGIYGDPFYAMDEIVRTVVPENAQGYESSDYYTYHVGRRYRYPRYACYDGYGDWYTNISYYDYDSYGCDRVRIFLGRQRYYYDTRYWRGSRRVYYGDYYRTHRQPPPLHGYKERTSGSTPTARAGYTPRPRPQDGAEVRGSSPESRGSDVRGSTRRPGSSEPRVGSSGASGRPSGGGTRPADVRGSSRRPESEPRVGNPDSRPETGGETQQEPRQQGRPVAPNRDRPTFQRRPQSEPRSTEPRSEPRRQAEPARESQPRRQAEPRRESPPPRTEPRRQSSPPSSGGRSSGGRSSGGRSSGGSSSSSRPSSEPSSPRSRPPGA